MIILIDNAKSESALFQKSYYQVKRTYDPKADILELKKTVRKD